LALRRIERFVGHRRIVAPCVTDQGGSSI
jgi:hypothetical protein